MAAVKENSARPAGRTENKPREPEDYRVILLNDNYTTMDFVIEILIFIFRKSEGEARRIMLDVHRKGRGIVGLYPWDIACTKAEQVHAAAAENEFPLRCIVERA
ncbi:MAG: ATP-dependent Clp protease adaptor ClpS [Treponema sp.]|jgi:ATP-dependent Clp protease adaptor protein ClpS|nr:ATP-dependent Clp protease adaptor ClpS [Treponema sp.]